MNRKVKFRNLKNFLIHKLINADKIQIGAHFEKEMNSDWNRISIFSYISLLKS